MCRHRLIIRVSAVLATLLAACGPSIPPLTAAEVESDLRGGAMQSLSMGACGLIGQYFKVNSVQDIALSPAGSGRTSGTARTEVTNRTVLRQSASCELEVAFRYRHDGTTWRLEKLERVGPAAGAGSDGEAELTHFH